MKRKVILQGPTTLTFSLPSVWVKKFGVAKGDELNVEEQGRELRINFDKEPIALKKELNVGSFERLGKSYITSLYRAGYDEISLSYLRDEYLETIQKTISNDTAGFEIIKQDGKNCVIKDLTGHSRDEFDNAIRRIWLLVINMSEESLKTL